MGKRVLLVLVVVGGVLLGCWTRPPGGDAREAVSSFRSLLLPGKIYGVGLAKGGTDKREALRQRAIDRGRADILFQLQERVEVVMMETFREEDENARTLGFIASVLVQVGRIDVRDATLEGEFFSKEEGTWRLLLSLSEKDLVDKTITIMEESQGSFAPQYDIQEIVKRFTRSLEETPLRSHLLKKKEEKSQEALDGGVRHLPSP